MRPPDPASLLRFLQAGLGGDRIQPEAEWATADFKDFARSRGVDGLLSALSIDNEPWAAAYRLVAQAQGSTLLEVLQALADRHVEAVTFKGIELATRYFPGCPLSVSLDIDLLVAMDDIQATKATLYSLGFTQSYFDKDSGRLVPRDLRQIGQTEATHYELAPFCKLVEIAADESVATFLQTTDLRPLYVRDGQAAVVVEIDIHHNVATDTTIEPVLARATRSRVFPGRTLSDADHLWINATRHYNEMAIHAKRSLRAYVYTAPLLKQQIDWDVVLGAASAFELRSSLYYPLRFMATLVGAAVPPEVLAAVHPRGGDGRDFGWQLGPLFGFVEPNPLELPAAARH